MRPQRCLLLANRRRPSAAASLRLRCWPVHVNRSPLVTLAIESSCDDTAVAILSRDDSSGRYSLPFNERISSDHRQFRGIEPIVAVQGHTGAIAPLIRRAIAYLPDAEPEKEHSSRHAVATKTKVCWAEDGTPKQVPDFISVTRGPGNAGNLGVGLTAAKGLAVAWDVPLLGAHHMQAHALTPRLVRALGIPMAADVSVAEKRSVSGSSVAAPEGGPDFPFLSLLVSGGHTQLVHSRSLTDHRIIATTLDTAIGNLLDQVSRSILPAEVLEASPDVMYGRLLESFGFSDPQDANRYAFFKPSASRAEEMQPAPTGYSWSLSLPMQNTRRLAYTFSSLHTVATRIAEASPSMGLEERRALARHVMAVAFRQLAGRLCLALEDLPDLRRAQTLVVAGGVACNRFLMHVLRETLAARGHHHLRICAPPPSLCTDNAAMIAWTGMEMFDAGFRSDLSILPIRKWPMDPDQGPGILGVDGWLRLSDDGQEHL